MKARIKGTDTVVECLQIGVLINENKGIECKYPNGAIEVIPGDCLVEIESFDWQSFRTEAAKDILCAVLPEIKIIDSNFQQSIENAISNSIDVADKLIKQLKDKEEK